MKLKVKKDYIQFINGQPLYFKKGEELDTFDDDETGYTYVVIKGVKYKFFLTIKLREYFEVIE